ncbi:putative bifunctional diguanylate cyclase/phosphodiesterase, partial [Actibacterium sp.]|uniref:putative bifunctional diguanylate cyclase/phosphodiesterase n=1 Tax=Actibacterium sp. TaxID=1872125 RepID=UPI0035688089
DAALAQGRASGKATAALVLAPEGLPDLADRFGPEAQDIALRRVVDRLSAALRDDDVLGQLVDGRLAIALSPMRRADLETLLQISGRALDALREPITIDGTTAYLSGSAGFCLQSRCPDPTGAALLAAAETALSEAQSNGTGAIRAYSAEMQKAVSRRHDLREELATALETRQIRPWFQPQISTDTGQVTGFEALARWAHPQRGLIPPVDFLGIVLQAGLSSRLTDEMLFQALSALRAWDQAGVHVPSVGVNFSDQELRDPELVDRIRWELDRFSLAPQRLTIEILETVVSGADDDVITRNIAALAQLGCGIDLDDFGTGHASISSIRRFTVRRLKIDRSFVTRVDRDREQQNLVAAILSMAERLNLETLAEGVETAGEHAMLAQLGCGHVQGFGIARPMPFEDTIGWIHRHREKLAQAASLGRQAG